MGLPLGSRQEKKEPRSERERTGQAKGVGRSRDERFLISFRGLDRAVVRMERGD